MLSVNKKISLSWNEAIAVLKELNLIVVSLDKIGSYYMDRDKYEFNNEMTRFIVEWKVIRRLAEARRILAEKFDDTLGDDDMDDLERAMEGLKYWSTPDDNPENLMK